MRVTVKIEDVEVTIERANFKEPMHVDTEKKTFDYTVKPTLEAATARAIELHKQKHERFKNPNV